ncbi:hypothetical protein [Persicitalea jodogahamensis]|uniref:Uncharacterized protein n=1 Tax=Persicitalea jodogahamensis TaxID=402147 RepID=A0A8J3D3A3_9BACT|nr:hypothetical protein [Persicitalea jodogahamensis]GHB63978.1 hypothetical protein GCM10007390_17310 [Persicitalea jodogahamensis]
MAEQIEVLGKGPRGPKGWTPVLLPVTDGARKLVRVSDWTGGQEPKPAAGYLGAAGLVEDIADATDFAGRGLVSVEQGNDADLIYTYTDGTTETIPAYFADVLAKAQEVDTNTLAVSQMLGMVETKREEVAQNTVTVSDARQDVENRQGLISLDTLAVSQMLSMVETKRQEVAQNTVTVSDARQDMEDRQSLVSQDTIAVSQMLSMVETKRDQVAQNTVTVSNARQDVETRQTQIGQTKVLIDAALAAALAAGWFPIITETTAARVLALTDAGREIRCTFAGAVSITVPPASSVAWADHTEIVLVQAGAGQVTIVPGAGVTINSSETLKSAKQYAYLGLKRVAANVWDLTGERQIA